LTRPAVLLFAGLDPSGGAGIGADIEAVSANGAHPLAVVTALTVQDNNRVHEVHPVDASLITRQVMLLAESIDIKAVKIGIPGNVDNARAIAQCINQLRGRWPGLPVVLDPVLASGHGDPLARGNVYAALAPLLACATLLVPNLMEAEVTGTTTCDHVLVTGGHAHGGVIVNRWHHQGEVREWSWPRLPGEYHGSGCTLAASIAARLALGENMQQAIEQGQAFCHGALERAYPIAPGQLIPGRAAHGRHPFQLKEAS
jgi:hydroxymethylpyrimidine/phosphomethylpyrimidine kinase